MGRDEVCTGQRASGTCDYEIIIQGGGGGYMPGEAFNLHLALSQGNAYAFVQNEGFYRIESNRGMDSGEELTWMGIAG